MTTHIQKAVAVLLVLIAAALIWWGIIGTNKQNDLAAEVPVETAHTLTSVSWQWQETQNFDGSVTVPADPTKFNLTFGTSTKGFTSSTDCNRLAGQYVVDGEVLSMGQMISTKMYCEGSSEMKYAQALGLVGSHSISGETLTMILLKDAGVMKFSAIK